MITGTTKIIAHLGYPTHTFKAPMIYNPYFQKNGVDAVVVPMGVKAEDFSEFLKPLFRLSNIHGALITMPHKVSVMELLDEISTNAKVAGSCNAVLLGADGKLIGDMFDGEGFVGGVLRRGRSITGTRVLLIGAGGVGSAIAASIAKAGASTIALVDESKAALDGLAGRLKLHYPSLEIETGSADPTGFDLVINATPLGMKNDDPLPVDVSRLAASTFVGEVVMKQEITPFLEAARAKGCDFQMGIDMLFEQIPAYLDFFGFPVATAEELRSTSQIKS